MTRHRISVDGVGVEAFTGGPAAAGVIVGTAHPSDRFDAGTVKLLAEMSGTGIVCLNPHPAAGTSPGAGVTLEDIVDRIEQARRILNLDRWIFWGMSGGGWLAQIYAYRYPESLKGIVIESACMCFRLRAADSSCILSPFHPAWKDRLMAERLLDDTPPTDHVIAADTEWIPIDGVGQVFRRRAGAALLVSPTPVSTAMRMMMPEFWNFDSRSWLGQVKVPTLVLAGSADPVAPTPHVRAIHQALPHSLFCEIKGAGHVPVAERNPEVTRAFGRLLSLAGCC